MRRVEYVKRKIDALLALKCIENDTVRNQSLFKWINQHQTTFDDRCSWNDTCGWGYLEYKVLNWVSESGMQEDSWKAALLHKKLFNKNLGEYGKPSFCSKKGRSFLLSMITDSSRSESERLAALNLLSSPYNIWSNWRYRDQYDLVIVDTEEQEYMLKTLKPLLKDDNLKSYAFSVIKNLSIPYTANLKNYNNLQLLPYIVEQYQNETPSKFKDNLAKFIYRHTDDETWKKLTGSKIAMIATLYLNHYDSSKQLLSLTISYQVRNADYELDEVPPKIKMQRIEDGQVVYEQELIATIVSVSYGSIKIDVSHLEKGTWYFYAFENTGNLDEIYWKSEPEVFIKD